MAENILRWTDAGLIYDEGFSRLKKRISKKLNEKTFISIGSLKQHPACRTILFELLNEFGFSAEQVTQVSDSLQAAPGKIFLSATHRIVKDRKQLIVSPIASTAISEILINENDNAISTGNLSLRLQTKVANGFSIPTEKKFSCLDLSRLEFPLLLRPWKKGDYFYPFGMKKKKKKVSDYLIDKKFSLPDKEKVVVIESGKKICCIVGERIDERFRITASTQSCLLIEKT